VVKNSYTFIMAGAPKTPQYGIDACRTGNKKRLFQNLGFERAAFENSGFTGCRPKNRKSFRKTNRVLRKASLRT
jgi:hypothetical protein